MKISQNTIELIKQFEGCRLIAYQDSAGIWTIGYGHTGGVKPGQTITQAQAEDYLAADLSKFEKNVSKYDRIYHWSQNEFDAMVCFSYNVGSINQLVGKGVRSRKTIAEKILSYNKTKGKVLNALKRRREAERTLFLGTDDKTAGSGAGRSVRDILEYSLAADGEKKISRNFKVKEFRCKDGSDKILIDVDFVTDKLQAIRDHFGAAVTINSAYRTAAYNKKVGGASKSFHMSGQAFDIAVKGHTPLEVAQYAQTIDINGIIQYNTFVHVDSREKRYWARDDNGKVTKKDEF